MSTANLLACNYGTANLEMVGYSMAMDAEVRDQFGRIGTRLRMIIKGVLHGTSTADIEAKVAAIIGDLSIDGRDLTITGAGGGTELTIAAAACQYGGPFPSIVMEDGEAPPYEFTNGDLTKVDSSTTTTVVGSSACS